jgi:hypothetical protein
MRQAVLGKIVLLLAALLGCAAVASPAHAFVAQVATSIPADSVNNDGQLQEAVYSAMYGVLKQAIAFSPSLVELRSVKVVGDRLYLLFLLADPDGEQTLKTFEAAEPHSAD